MCVSTDSMDNGHCIGKAQIREVIPCGWTRVDNAVLPVLASIKGGQTIAVYVALKSFADQDGICWPSLESISSRSGVCIRKVQDILDVMVSIDPPILERERRNTGAGRASNRYRFLDTPTAPHAIGIEAQRHHMPGPTAPHAGPNGTTCQGTRSKEQEPENKNQDIFPNLLSEVIEGWNALGPDIGPPIRNPNKPPKAILEVYKRLERDDELREAFSDVPAIMAAIRKATYCHGEGWFTLPWIFTRDQHTKELRVQRILNGVYRSKGNGSQKPAAAESSDDIIERLLASEQQGISE